MADWQLYATVTGSAMAMAANATAASVANHVADTDPIPTYLATQRQVGTSQNSPLAKAVRAAVTADVSSTPSISPGGVVPLYGSGSMIQPGGWVTIYGSHLAGTTAAWKGDFPTSLGGTTVEINGKPAYLSYVSPGQINLQAPDDVSRGPVLVSVQTSAGQATSVVTLNSLSPAFELSYKNFISGIILRSDGSGAYANGSYDILGPTGKCWGYPTVAAKAGDYVELFAVGFGPTNPTVAAGKVFSGAAPITSSISLFINNVPIVPVFVGLSSAGVYQINVVIPPGLGEGNVPVLAVVGGMQTQPGLVFALPTTATTNVAACPVIGTGGTGGGGYGGGGGGGTGFGGTGGTGGTGGGGGGGTGGGGGGGGGGTSARGGHMGGKPYRPKLHFPPSSGN